MVKRTKAKHKKPMAKVGRPSGKKRPAARDPEPQPKKPRTSTIKAAAPALARAAAAVAPARSGDKHAAKEEAAKQLMAMMPKVPPNREGGWASLGLKVNLEEDPSKCMKVKQDQKMYYKCFQQAMVTESERVEKNGGVGEGGKALSKRPDRVAQKMFSEHMKEAGGKVSKKEECSKHFGFVPGILLNDRFYTRAEMSVIGLHGPPLAGIEYMTADEVQRMTGGKYQHPVCTSIIIAGCYEDNSDDGQTLTYTGQGGNDLLGNKKQLKDQLFEAGNRALAGNVDTGIPVRVCRKNNDDNSTYGVVYTFDGLYRVTKWWTEKGKEGTLVFQYALERLPHAKPLLSRSVEFGGLKMLPLTTNVHTRAGLICTDLSLGVERTPVVVVNEVDDELPPGLDPSNPTHLPFLKHHIDEEGKDIPFKTSTADFKYTTTLVYDDAVPRPDMTPPVKRTPGMNDDKFRELLHNVLKSKLTTRALPYHLNGSTDGQVAERQEAAGKGKKERRDRQEVVRLCECPHILVYECGAWCGCPYGDRCIQARAAQGVNFRLEVFKTCDGRGWGVRCWDMIPVGATVAAFIGKIYRRADAEALNHVYQFSMQSRPRSEDLEEEVASGEDEDEEDGEEMKYSVDAMDCGNVARYINHSCDPNCYVQPVLCGHHDVDFPTITFVAYKNIPPLTEITYDYGPGYVRLQLGGDCKCGVDTCRRHRYTRAESDS